MLQQFETCPDWGARSSNSSLDSNQLRATGGRKAPVRREMSKQAREQCLWPALYGWERKGACAVDRRSKNDVAAVLLIAFVSSFPECIDCVTTGNNRQLHSSKRLCGVADAAPVIGEPPQRWRSVVQPQLVQSFVLLFLVANILADHGFVPAHCGHELSPAPRNARQQNCASVLRTLAPDGLRHRVLGRNQDHHMHMVAQQLPLFDSALPLLGQLPKDLAQMRPQLHVQRSSPALREEHDVIFAVPLRMA